MRYFEYEKVADEAKIPKDKLEKLTKMVRQEFPKDDMMFELHLLRACMSVQEGYLTIDEAIRSEKAA